MVVTVRSGDPITFTWSVSIPPNCIGIKLALVTNAVSRNGSMTLRPLSPAAVQLSATKDGQRSVLAEIRVDTILPRVVEIKGNTPEWRGLLIYAVGAAYVEGAEQRRIVRLWPNVDMDLSYYFPIYVRNGVTLTGDQDIRPSAQVDSVDGSAVRDGESSAAFTPMASLSPTAWGGVVPGRFGVRLGPRLFTRAATGVAGQFRIDCSGGKNGNNVRFSGFRLIGREQSVTADASDVGIVIQSCKGVEIANMELSGWSGSAVQAGDKDRQIAEPTPENNYAIDPNVVVRIHDNFIHHNQNDNLGYGLNLSSFPMVEHNVFDFNRHAIAGGAEPPSGYVATGNLILKGGGEHVNHTTPVGIPWQTHQFDVHGTENCNYVPHSCGTAGSFFVMTHNTFQYWSGSAIKIRGVPTYNIEIGANVFPHEGESDAIELQQSSNRISIASTNMYKTDTFGRYKTCDFDGDGRDDLFLATGETWWYASAGQVHWSFLRQSPEPDEQLGVGYFNGDRVCDVVTSRGAPDRRVLAISSGGRLPWTQLQGNYAMPFKELRFVDFDRDGRTDVFWRERSGQWRWFSVGSIGNSNEPRVQHDELASSGAPLETLRFANLAPQPGNPRDHRRDTKLDVLRFASGQIHVSRDGIDPWTPLGSLRFEAHHSFLVADVNDDGQDDIVRFSAQPNNPDDPAYFVATWEVSWSGASDWVSLKQFAIDRRGFSAVHAGRFDGRAGADLLVIEPTRIGRVYTHQNGAVARLNIYPY